jgi:hypothetical protein
MRDSIILGVLMNIYKKFVFCYKNSGFYRVIGRAGESFRKYAASSSILGFFDKEWKIGRAWKGSLIFKLLKQPLRLFKYASNRLSDGTNSTLEGSKALSGIKVLLENLLNMSARVYGLLFLTFAATQGLLELMFNNGGMLLDMKSIVRLALFLAGTVLILVNKPVKSLVEGSITGRIAHDFFVIRGLKDGTDNKI